MTKEEFNSILEDKLNKFSNDTLLNNYSQQLVAHKLKAKFAKTYRLNYVWSKLLGAISACCFLLDGDIESKIALKSLNKIAYILENISEISENATEYDLDFFKILSSLCYDIAGYQANAYCLIKKIETYRLTGNSYLKLDEDNFIIELIICIILKKLPKARELINEKKNENNLSESFSTLLLAFESWVNIILDLKDKDVIPLFSKAYTLYLKAGNIYISQLLLLFIIKIKKFLKRSVYLNLRNTVADNPVWRKYIKLLSNDYYSKHNQIQNVNDKKSIYEFWLSQIRAIDDGLLTKDESFVVQMPTSAGKTFIAELFILKYLITTRKKVLYISPFKSLASEKVSELNTYFVNLGYKVSALLGSYEYELGLTSIYKNTDVFVFTPEKTDSILRFLPDFFDNIAAIVIDEGHIVGDLNYRAALTEILLIKIKMRYPEIKMLFLSAVMPSYNAEEYAEWLSQNKQNVLRSRLFFDSQPEEEWEPTRKNIGFFQWKTPTNGMIQFSNIEINDNETGNTKSAFVPNFLKHNEYGINCYQKKPETAACLGIKLSETGNTLIFCGQVRGIRAVAKRLRTIFSSSTLPCGFEPDENKESYYYSKLWYGESHLITQNILYGVGIHFGDMPEQVKSAVESDYRLRKLKIMLCTNTIGQGVNFPIKNIIFYDTTVGYRNGQELITCRDFWNIIGRVGRAEKETEGNIVYIINSSTDLKNYKLFINKNNIEESKSLIYSVLDLFIAQRIDEDELDIFVLNVTETFLLDEITEEIFESDYELIELLIKNSLFYIQSKNDNLDNEKIRLSFQRAFSNIRSENPSLLELKEFSKTGLCIEDNKKIISFIEENKNLIESFLLQKDLNLFIDIFIDMLNKKDFGVISDDYKLQKVITNLNSWSQYKQCIKKWINNDSIENICQQFKNDKEQENFFILLSRGLLYIFPWISNVLIILISYVLKLEYLELDEKIRNIPTFMKYGLNNKLACIARQYGIKNRRTALFLVEMSSATSENDFTSWLVNLQESDINSINLPDFEKENIIDTVFNMVPISNRSNATSFTFEVVGTKYDDERKRNSLLVRYSDNLYLERDKENQYDPYAVLVMKDKKALGYIPREYTKFIATEMDINETKYDIKITNICLSFDSSYNKVTIQIDLLGM